MLSMKELLSRCDHTLLRQDATWAEIRQVCDEGIQFGCASVCIPPAYVRQAAEHVGNQIKICTVIGFPNGYSATPVKVFETEEAIRAGADEIDMVINIGWAKDARWDDLLAEIKAVKASCQGRILKVIVEACLLTEEEKVALCRIVTQAGAEYIKTSTGFGGGGATLEDVALFKAHIGPEVKIKAAGGIRTVEKAEAMIEVGAVRSGTSALVLVAKRELVGPHHLR